MDTQGTTIAVIDTDGSGGTTVKVVVGFLIGAVVGIGGTWLIMRDHSNTDEAGSLTATTTPETGGVVTSTTGNAMSTGGTTLVPSGEFSVVSQSAGDIVTIDKVAFGEGGGWVVIHEDSNGGLGRALGAAWFAQGSWNGSVSLLRPTESGKTYHAVLYSDNGGDKQFSLIDDKPFLSQIDGKMVEQTFTVQ